MNATRSAKHKRTDGKKLSLARYRPFFLSGQKKEEVKVENVSVPILIGNALSDDDWTSHNAGLGENN